MQFSDFVKFLEGVFLGQVDSSWSYIPVVVARVIILYMYAYLLLRLMGKRQNKQLTMFDAVVIVAIGSIVGDPTVSVEIPIIFSMIALSIILALELGFIMLIQKSRRIEAIVESQPTLLIENGKTNYKRVRKERLGTDELYSKLRLQGISNLGQIQRAYLEESGDISVFQQKNPQLSLNILPKNLGSPSHYNYGDKIKDSSSYYCWKCSEELTFNKEKKFPRCPICNSPEWVASEKQNNKSELHE